MDDKNSLLNKNLIDLFCHKVPDFEIARELIALGADINAVTDKENISLDEKDYHMASIFEAASQVHISNRKGLPYTL